ncbi:MAG: hypothetical protein R8M37_01160 [Alphaproteobacteria bacterium]|nr:hypothetical protein [Alphaproteobacteria bacterium]
MFKVDERHDVRCMPFNNMTGYESPEAMSVENSRTATERSMAYLRVTLARMEQERAELVKNPKSPAKIIARYDEIIANIRGTLKGHSR